MSEDSEVKVAIKATTEGFAKSVSEASEHISGMGKQAEGTIQNLGNVMSSFNSGSVAGLTAGVGELGAGVGELGAGLAALGPAALVIGAVALAFEGLAKAAEVAKDAIEKTLALSETMDTLSYQTGETLEQLNRYHAALKMVGGSEADLGVLIKGMTRQLKEGEEGINKNGIATRDASGELLTFGRYVENVMLKANSMANAQERNKVLTLALGRAAVEAGEQLSDFVEVLKTSDVESDKFSSAIGIKDIEAMETFRKESAKVTLAIEAIQVTIGRELLPIVSELVSSFGNSLPEAVEFVRKAIAGLSITILELSLEFKQASIVAAAATLTLQAASEGNLTAVKQIWISALDTINAKALETQSRMENIAARAAGMGGVVKLGDQAPKGKGHFKDPKDDDKSDQASMKLVQTYKLQLEEIKATDDSFHQDETEKELAFWESKLSLVQQGTKGYLAILSETNKLKQKLREEDEKAIIKEYELEVAQAGHSYEKKKALLTSESEFLKGIHGAESEQYKTSLIKIEQLELQHAEKIKEAQKLMADGRREAQLGILAAEEANIKTRTQLGLQSAEQEIQALIELEARKLEIKTAALKEQMAVEFDPAKFQELSNQREAAVRESDAKIEGLNSQMAINATAEWRDYTNQFRSETQNQVAAYLGGAQTIGQTWQKTMLNMGHILDQAIAKMVTRWIMGESLKTQASAGGVAARVALEVWAATKTIATKVWEGLKWIAVEGWKAASAAYASVAAIPVVGWILAPVVAGAALAAVVAMGSKIASAEGGYDIPAGVNPIVQTHAEEMVLPKEQANAIRDMAKGGGGGGDTIVIQAMDSKSFHEYLHANRGAVASAIKTLTRDGRTG